MTATATLEPADHVPPTRGNGACLDDRPDEQVDRRFLAIIGANYPGHPAVADVGSAVGRRQRRPPRPACHVATGVLPGPPAGTGRCAAPGRVGTTWNDRRRPRQRSPPAWRTGPSSAPIPHRDP